MSSSGTDGGSDSGGSSGRGGAGLASGGHPDRGGGSGPGRLLRLLGWLGALTFSLACFGLFARAVYLDHHVGEPRITVDFSRAGDWETAGFRVWKEEPHILWLTTVNHDPPFDVPLRGRLGVRIRDPHGALVLDRTFEGTEIDHRRPDNMTWTRLAELDLEGTAWRSWRLEARVTETDPGFASSGFSTVLIRPDRPSRGMGGLIFYALPIPGFLFLLAAFGLAAWTWKADGVRWPLPVTAVLGMVAFVAYAVSFGA